MDKLWLKGMLMGVALMAASAARADLVTTLPSVNINGTSYTVAFHTSTTFNALWDLDNDRAFTDNDGSVFNSLPTFWGDIAGGQAAVDAIILGLGSDDWLQATTGGSGTIYSDSFSVPVGWGPASLFEKVYTFRDRFGALATENTEGEFIFPNTQIKTWASFSEAAPVPVPGAFWLLGSGLIGLAGVARKNK